MKIAVGLGDSIIQGQGQSGGASGAFIAYAGAILGWTVVNQGVGSSGYLVSLFSEPTFRSRLSGVVAANPDVVVIEGGTNDVPAFGVSLADLTAEVTLFYAALRAALPSAKFYILAPSRQSRVLADILAIRDMLKIVTAPYGTFIDWLSPYWITGSGSVGHATGDGNADLYVNGSDLTHPSADGHKYLGQRLAFAISPPSTGLVGGW